MYSAIAWLKAHPRRAAWLAAAVLPLLWLIVYGQTLTRGWVIAPEDDLLWLQMVRGAKLTDIPFWFTYQPAFFYRPLARISFYLDYAMWGDNPLGFRLTTLVLCVATAGALGWLVYEATRSRLAAFFAASLYEIYPGNWETAYWVSARADLLATLLVLTTLALMLRAKRKGRFALWLAAIGCAAAAMFSKEMGAALLPIVAVWAAITSPPLRRSGWHWAWTGVTLVVLAALTVGYWWLRSMATPMGAHHLEELARLELPLAKALRWGQSWWYYPVVVRWHFIAQGAVPGMMTLLVAPKAFMAFWGTLAVWAAALVLVFIRARRAALMFLVFHALAVLPAVGEAVQVPFRRFFYLPVAGDHALTAVVCWTLLGWCRERWPRWGWAALGVYFALLVGFTRNAWIMATCLHERLFGR